MAVPRTLQREQGLRTRAASVDASGGQHTHTKCDILHRLVVPEHSFSRPMLVNSGSIRIVLALTADCMVFDACVCVCVCEPDSLAWAAS
eukprot:1798798-Amphidinium_carterae.2